MGGFGSVILLFIKPGVQSAAQGALHKAESWGLLEPGVQCPAQPAATGTALVDGAEGLK